MLQKYCLGGMLGAASLVLFPAAACAQTRQFDLPAQPARTGIPAFGQQAGVQIIVPTDALEGIRTPRIKGAIDTMDALKRLIARSGLEIVSTQGNTIILRRGRRPAAPTEPSRPQPRNSSEAAPKASQRARPAGADARDDIVVVATRRAQSPTETPAAVDVFSGETLADRGNNDLAKKLQFLAPSFNYTQSQGLITAVGTRPPSLRGMGIDQVLVLVNGKRRHASAVLNTNNGFGRGTVPVDLNAIPAEAIERVEILRDGASAQYGSDAIAGVINIVLRKDAAGGMVSAQGGITENGDGESGIFTTRGGFGIGEGGFLTVTAQARLHGPTNYAGIDTRVGRRTLKIGEPKSSDLSFALNGELPVSWGTLYGYASFDKRYTEAFGGAFRLGNVFPAVYPDGFLPGVDQYLYDVGATLGTNGSMGSWDWDLSDTIGYNRADFEAFDTVNRSLGATSPRRFDTGAQQYLQNLVNLTVNRDFENVLAGAHLVLGGEYRYETYDLIPGEPNSWFGEGATGFPGFNPPVPVHPDRNAFSGFIDTSVSLMKGLDVGLAGRYEHYSDFGSHVTGKGSLFWRLSDLVALRGTASTGIRAPSLQQQYYSSVSSQFIAPTPANPTGLVLVRNAAVDDPVARALGAVPLKEESSRNLTAGLVLTPMRGLTFTADYFNIKVDDRIAYSEILQGPAVDAILRANGIANANTVRFFTNAADTRTEGFEFVLRWQGRLGADTGLSLNLAYADMKNKVLRVRQNPALPSLPLLAQRALLVITDSQPKTKFTFNGGLTHGPFDLNVDVVRFGPYAFVPLAAFQSFSPKWQVNIGAGVNLAGGWRLQGGVLNATNEYPDEIAGQIDGRRYESLGGLGADGREYYLRVTKTF